MPMGSPLLRTNSKQLTPSLLREAKPVDVVAAQPATPAVASAGDAFEATPRPALVSLGGASTLG